VDHILDLPFSQISVLHLFTTTTMADKPKAEVKVKRLFDPTEIRADYLGRLLSGPSDYTPPEFIDYTSADHRLNPNPVLNCPFNT
jgi:hypothetical protein